MHIIHKSLYMAMWGNHLFSQLSF